MWFSSDSLHVVWKHKSPCCLHWIGNTDTDLSICSHSIHFEIMCGFTVSESKLQKSRKSLMKAWKCEDYSVKRVCKDAIHTLCVFVEEQTLIHMNILQIITLLNLDIQHSVNVFFFCQSERQSEVSYYPWLHELDESIYEWFSECGYWKEPLHMQISN